MVQLVSLLLYLLDQLLIVVFVEIYFTVAVLHLELESRRLAA